MTNSTAKVVSIGQVRPGSPEALRLINECRSMAQRFLSDAIQQLFQKNDDTLFGFAEKASDEEANSLYFDAMRALRLKKDEIVRGFLERVGEGFVRLQKQEQTEVAAEAKGTITLSLLDDAELEESLAIQSMAEKVESDSAEEIAPLRHRLASLIGSAPLGTREDPIGPAALGEGYREALRSLETGIEVRLVLYKLFDKFLVSHIDELYTELNGFLAKNGVLPEFKIRPRPERAKAAKRGRKRSDEDEEEREDKETDELLPLLRDLLTQQRGSGNGTGNGSGGGAGGTGGGVAPEPQQVVSALTALQQQAAAMQSGPVVPVSPEAVRAALQEQFARAGQAGSVSALSRQDSDLIDLISMMFEYILDDNALPDSVRVLLARLQIPMLKVALVDRSFFSKARHPARRLLNMLATAGMGLDEAPENSPRFAEIQRVVNVILEGLTDDVGLFETLANEFEEFLAQAGEIELRAAKAQTIGLRAREAREQIRMAVHRKLDEFVAAQPIPQPVEDLLRGVWTDVLVETRFLKDQTVWQPRTQLLRDMVFSVTPKTSREERLALPPVIARIVGTLRSGLASIGLSAERIDATVAMLEPYHLAVVQGKPLPVDGDLSFDETPFPEEESSPVADGRAKVKAVSPVDAMIAEMQAQLAEVGAAEELDYLLQESPESAAISDVVEAAPETEEHRHQDEYLQLARTYTVGTWFNFTRPDGTSRRAKLTWKSNLLDECIFLDWRMKMVAELNMAQFAGRLYDGSVTELQDTPLFDRAMDALMGKLRNKSA